jgi:hypothetical protein
MNAPNDEIDGVSGMKMCDNARLRILQRTIGNLINAPARVPLGHRLIG